jgi:hypothetical protein
MSLILIPALLLAAVQAPDKPGDTPAAPAESHCRMPPPPPAAHQRRITELLAATDGASAARAFHVRNIPEEYEIVGALGLCTTMQSLIEQNNRPYDMLSTVDPRSGATRELWFDISSFFGHEF